jgi:hypothetical protein
MEDLPSEMLYEIFKNLDYLDLFTCATLCKRFYYIVKYINPFKNKGKLRKTFIEYAIKCDDRKLFNNSLIDVRDILFDDYDEITLRINEKAVNNHTMYYFKYNRAVLFNNFIKVFIKQNCIKELQDCIHESIIHCIKTNNIRFYLILLHVDPDIIWMFRMCYAKFIIRCKNKVMLEFSIGYLNKFKSIKTILESLILESSLLTFYDYGSMEAVHIKDSISKYIEEGYYEQLCRKFKYDPTLKKY